MKINFKIVLIILLVSTVTGLFYNYFSSSGIPLIAEEKTLKWADDSLFIESNDNIISDTLKKSLPEDPKEKINEKENKETKVINNEKEETTAETDKSPEVKINEEAQLTEPKAINLNQAYTLYKQNILFIDAREPADYQYAHIKNAINIPADHFDDNNHMLNKINKDQIIVTYCGGSDCDLSVVLGNIMFDLGYKKIYVFFGGWNEWLEANYPIEKGVQTE